MAKKSIKAKIKTLAILTFKFSPKKGRFVAGTEYVSARSPMIWGIIKKGAMMAPSASGVDRMVEGGVNIVSVDFSSALNAGVSVTTLASKFRNFVVVGQGKTAGIYCRNEEGKYSFFTTKEEDLPSIDARYLADDGVLVQKFCAGASYTGASGAKDGKLYFVHVPLGTWKLHLNGVTSGAFNALFALNRKGMKGGELVKTAVRFGGRMSAEMESHRRFHSVALYMGKFGKENSLDGEFFFAGNKFTPVGVSTHDRTFTIKGQGVAISSSSIQTMIHSLDKKPMYASTSMMSSIFEDVKSNPESKYSGRVVIFGNYGKYQPELLADLNAVKTNGDWSKWDQHISEIYGDVDAEEDGVISLSTQVISKLLAVDFEKTADFIKTKFAAYCRETYTLPTVQQGTKLPSEKMMEDSFARAAATLKLDPKAGSKYRSFFYGWLIAQRAQVRKTMSTLKIPVAGYHRTAIGDIATMFGKYVLAPNEVVSSSITAGITGIMVKYPSAGLREYVRVTALSVDKYLERAKEVLNDDEFAVVEELLRNMAGKLVMVSGKEILRNMLAGFDFDTDSLFIYTETEIVDLLSKQQGIAVIIDSSKSVDKTTDFMKYSCDETVFYEAVMRTLNKGVTANVGCVVNFFTMWQRMYVEGAYESARKILIGTYHNNGKGECGYEKVFHVFHDEETGIDCVKVDAELMDKMWKQLRTMSLTDESIRDFLEDINVAAGRFSSEICIDIIKHNYVLRIPGLDNLLKTTDDYKFNGGFGGNGKKIHDVAEYLNSLKAIEEAAFEDAKNKIASIPMDLAANQAKECRDAWLDLTVDQRNTIVKLVDDLGAIRANYAKMKEDPSLVQDVYKYWEGELRTFTENLKPFERIQVLFGAVICGDVNVFITRALGTVLLPEWYAFVAYYSEREGVMLHVVEANLSMPTDKKTRFVRIVSNDKDILHAMQGVFVGISTEERRRKAIFSTEKCGNGICLVVNGKKVKASGNKALFVFVGKNKNSLSQEILRSYDGFNGKAMFSSFTGGKDRNGYHTLMIILRDNKMI